MPDGENHEESQMDEDENELEYKKEKEKYKKSKTHKKNAFPFRALKCMCGDVITSGMKKCPGCGKSAEKIVEEVRSRFYRVNFETSSSDERIDNNENKEENKNENENND